jgi:hypothetical protein
MTGWVRVAIVASCMALLSGCAVLDELATTDQHGNNEARIAAGLREALQVGSERAADRVGRVDGYLANEMIRIGLPESMNSAASRLRQVGLGRQVDQLEIAMNRAAEAAAEEAVTLFREAISGMRPADVMAVFRGGDDAATRYLRNQSETRLRQRYQPIVRRHLDQVQGLDYYREIAERWNRLPMVDPLEVDLEAHVTDRALDGLFLILAEEERRIRSDPVARTTELLREVFGRS